MSYSLLKYFIVVCSFPIVCACSLPDHSTESGRAEPFLGSNTTGFSRTLKLPILTVSTGDMTGKMTRVDFEVVRVPGSELPLAVSVLEDTPSGSGPMIRASLWQAATVAAITRVENLKDLKITVRLSGRVDGPSAGAAFTLGILTALDGRELPQDFVITGTILPDGTVGRVGGVPAKIRAAGSAGIKRVFVPAYSRMETDTASGQDVDLKYLAESLGMQCVFVENIEQAYRGVHKLSAGTDSHASHDNFVLPKPIEDICKRLYREDMARGEKLLARIPAYEQKLLMTDPLFFALGEANKRKAKDAFQSGKFFAAADAARVWVMYLRARESNAATVASIKQNNELDYLNELVEKLEIARKSFEEAALKTIQDQVEDRRFSGSGVQFVASTYEFIGVLAYLDVLQESMLKVDPNDKEALKNAIFTTSVWQMLLLNFCKEALSSSTSDWLELSRSIPDAKPRTDIFLTENLFHSSMSAAEETLETNVIQAWGNEARLERPKVIERLSSFDADFAAGLTSRLVPRMLHQKLQDSSERSTAMIALATQMEALGTADAACALVRWSELDPQPNAEGRLTYHRTDLLTYLIRNARKNAVESIAMCSDRGIPCVQPIALLEKADMESGDKEEDQTSVLKVYWQATLQAKALIMMFDGMRK